MLKPEQVFETHLEKFDNANCRWWGWQWFQVAAMEEEMEEVFRKKAGQLITMMIDDNNLDKDDDNMEY